MADVATVTPITKNPRATEAEINSRFLIDTARALIKHGHTPESLLKEYDDPLLRELARVMQWILDGKAPEE